MVSETIFPACNKMGYGTRSEASSGRMLFLAAGTIGAFTVSRNDSTEREGSDLVMLAGFGFCIMYNQEPNLIFVPTVRIIGRCDSCDCSNSELL